MLFLSCYCMSLFHFISYNLVELFLVGELVACSVGANFTPHVITVAAGEVKAEPGLILKIIITKKG